METFDKESDLLKFLCISDSFVPRLWINDYFSLLTFDVDILTETFLIEIQNDLDAIKQLNEGRDTILSKIMECESASLKELEKSSEDKKIFLKNLYDHVVESIKKNCADSNGSLIIEEKSLLLEKLTRNETDFEFQMHTLLSNIFNKFCFLVKESDLTNTSENSPQRIKFLWIMDFYIGKEAIK